MEHTKISWATHTWSPWYGCTKISDGCSHCYAYEWGKRFGRDCYGPGKNRIINKDWNKPLRWNKEAYKNAPERPRIFPSLCDWLDAEVDPVWRRKFASLIKATPNLDWQTLTKRNFDTKDIVRLFESDEVLPDNIWFGVTCENQLEFNRRAPLLLDVQASVRWISFEPLLGPIDFGGKLKQYCDWVVVGGESGPEFRLCHGQWVEDIKDQSQAEGVSVYVKQGSGSRPGFQGNIDDDTWGFKQFPTPKLHKA